MRIVASVHRAHRSDKMSFPTRHSMYHLMSGFVTRAFQSGPSITAPTKKGGEKKGHSAIDEVGTREYPVNIHKRVHRVGSKKRDPGALKEIWEFAVEEMGAPDVRTDTRLNTAVWATGRRNVLYCNRVRLSRKHSVGGASPNRLYTVVTYVPVATFKKLHTVNVDENSLLIVQ
ncbi:60S ribosomal protein L31-like [Sturnira hondurensis]|uniref:60S ribosomal protein L31-like n=1 Tax=Sturnira hondurensis TaxID=192404 RepID=UPI00187A99CC|nr:60S ribosomal protein L31-like [Sturnira hondurensis]